MAGAGPVPERVASPRRSPALPVPGRPELAAAQGLRIWMTRGVPGWHPDSPSWAHPAVWRLSTWGRILGSLWWSHCPNPHWEAAGSALAALQRPSPRGATRVCQVPTLSQPPQTPAP